MRSFAFDECQKDYFDSKERERERERWRERIRACEIIISILPDTLRLKTSSSRRLAGQGLSSIISTERAREIRLPSRSEKHAAAVAKSYVDPNVFNCLEFSEKIIFRRDTKYNYCYSIDLLKHAVCFATSNDLISLSANISKTHVASTWEASLLGQSNH